MASLCLTVLVQQPVVPADGHKFAGAVTQPPPVLARFAMTNFKPFGTVCETSTIYDADEKLWKRWFLDTADATSKPVLRLATSVEGSSWMREGNVCFESSADAEDWDNEIVGKPAIVMNPKAPRAKRFMMWYAGKNNRTLRPNGICETSIGLAFSADGRNFKRINAGNSPYSVEGLVLTAADAFSDSKDVVEGCLGQPNVTFDGGKFALSFYKVGCGASGQILGAGISTATSQDGVNWQIEAASPVTVNIVGKNTTAGPLVERLKQLADAYYESSM